MTGEETMSLYHNSSEQLLFADKNSRNYLKKITNQAIDLIAAVHKAGLSSIPQWNKGKEAKAIKHLEKVHSDVHRTVAITMVLLDRIDFFIRQLFAMVQLVQPQNSNRLDKAYDELRMALDLNDEDLKILEDSLNIFDPIITTGDSKIPFSNADAWRVSKNLELNQKKVNANSYDPAFKLRTVRSATRDKTEIVLLAWNVRLGAQNLYNSLPPSHTSMASLT